MYNAERVIPVTNVIISVFKRLKHRCVKIMKQNIHIKRIQNCFFLWTLFETPVIEDTI